MAEKKVKPPVSVLEAATKKRQNALLFGGLAVLVVIAAAVALMTETKPGARDAAKKAETRSLAMGPRDADKESFRSQIQTDVEDISKRLKTSEQQVKQLQDEIKAVRKDSGTVRPSAAPDTGAAAAPAQPPVPPPPGPASGAPFAVVGAKALPPPSPPAAKFEIVRLGAQGNSTARPAMAGATPATHPTSGGEGAEGSKRRVAERFGDDDPLTNNRSGGRTVETYIPPAFMRVVMLNGVDAPTGGNAQNSTMPVLMEVIEDATLPNKFRAPLRSCLILGDSYGDLSSERLLIRLTRMSCVAEDGGAIDVKVSGYVNGPDGKVGVRGLLVTKTGQLMANTLLAGLISGFGQAISLTGQQQNTTVNGAVTSTVTNPWTAGFGNGVSTAFSNVASYYQKLAEKIYPVVSVESGTVVDVVLSRGTTIEVTQKP